MVRGPLPRPLDLRTIRLAGGCLTRRRGGRSGAERSNEPLAVFLELTDLGLDARRDVVDGDEERHLPVTEGVDHLTIAAADLEDRLSVRHELHLGEVFREACPLGEELPGAANALERHPSVEQ